MTRISTEFSLYSDHHRLCTEILTEAIRLTHGDRGAVFLRADDEKDIAGKLVSLIGTNLTEKQIVIKSNEGVAGYCFTHKETLLINDAESHPQFFPAVDKATGYRTRSIICVPLQLPGVDTLGVIEVLNSTRGGFRDEDLHVLQILALFTSFALFKNTTIQVLAEENQVLNHERRSWLMQNADAPTSSTNETLLDIYRKLPQIARSESNILIEGESGTGKEVLTKQIHLESERGKGPFVAINCAAIPESLFESEIFGVVRGAATGTIARKGKVEMADGGTLFLDEIGEMPLHLQSKLLRVLQDKKVAPLGSDQKPHAVDFRLIVATNQDLKEMVERKQFREDLYYRISVVQLRIPPLRERLDDLPQICSVILAKFVQTRGWVSKTLTKESMIKLRSYRWPGNIRELQNRLEAAMITSGDSREIRPEHITIPGLKEPRMSVSVVAIRDAGGFNLKVAKANFERQLIEAALSQAKGNKTAAANLLGITREGLRKAMQKF